MTGQTRTSHTLKSDHLPDGQAAFLLDRLGEEIDAALARPINVAGLGMMVELRNALKFNLKPDRTSVEVLTFLYAGHPEFSASWA